MKQVEVYGIPNCDITRKALKWMKDNNIGFIFHDYKIVGADQSKLEAWSKQVGWETLFNKKSTTWRSLSPAEQAGVINEATAIKIMMKNNSIIKRPVIEAGRHLLVGFKEEHYSTQLK